MQILAAVGDPIDPSSVIQGAIDATSGTLGVVLAAAVGLSGTVYAVQYGWKKFRSTSK